ncbi:MAG: TlpA family protein disulfide reductase, partial [Planctomycetaceae bacterium]|nr:TlpA family protein disulfide reductase [Planctomycetaceae bacterium]
GCTGRCEGPGVREPVERSSVRGGGPMHHRMNKGVLAVVALAAVALFVLVGPKLGLAGVFASEAEDFTLYDRRGRATTLSDLRGKVVVLDFWATWCPPCRKAIPALAGIADDYAGRAVVLGINVNENNANPTKVAVDLGANYPILLEGDAVAEMYGVRGLPTLVVVDREGKVVYTGSGWGGSKEQQVREAIEAALE